MSVSRIVDVNVEVSDDHQRRRVGRQPLQQVAEIVEERLCHDDDDGVETSAMNVRADDFKRLDFGTVYDLLPFVFECLF